MTTLMITAPATLPAGKLIATGVAAEEYLADYADTYHEWVKGAIIHMTPVSLRHTQLTQYLLQLLNAYFSFNPVGTVLNAPFVMRLEITESFREPDLQVVLHANTMNLTATAMNGPADICIEVVSPESTTRDYGDKFAEYEQAGVHEYWIIDPQCQEARFHRLQPSKLYASIPLDESNDYRTPLLPNLVLQVLTLWQENLPDFAAIWQAVQTMFDTGQG